MLKFIELNADKSPKTNFSITYSNLDRLENAGLLLNRNTVIVDFDNDNFEEQRIINYFIQNFPTLSVETDRGIHLYYSIPKNINIKKRADLITVGGFQVDYLTGDKAYAIVKRRGVQRKTNRPLTLDNLPELPVLLYPLFKQKNLLSGMVKGDGRNEALFHHLRYVLEEYKTVKIEGLGDFINSNVFKEPLSLKELNNIINSVPNYVDLEKAYTGNPKDMIAFAKFMVKILDIKYYNNLLYFKDDLKYSTNQIKLKRLMAQYLELKTTQDNEAINQMYKYANFIENGSDNFYVKIRNGIIVEDKVINQDCGFTPFYLDIEYNPMAYDENVDNFLNFICLDDKQLRLVIEELLGHCLMIDRFPHKMFFLIGKGANGKSTFVEMITKWTGELSSHIDIANFDDSTSIASLIGKLVNIADDVDAIYFEKSKNLKTMASGNTIGARPIYSQPITFKNTATLIFTANEPPTFKDKSDGIIRRLMVIPFRNKVKRRIYNLDELLSTDNAKSYLLNLALKGIKRLYDNGLEFSECKVIKEATKEYQLENDTTLSFLNDCTHSIENIETASIYSQYVSYTESMKQKPLSKNKFTRRLKELGYTTKVKTSNNCSIRVYVKE